jgi:hypothetical protein
MTILSFPSTVPAPSDMTFGLAANTMSGGRSPFDGTEQTLAQPGARWIAELRWRDLDLAQWRALCAFLDRLGGRAGRFTWSPIVRFGRRGTATGTPTVSGAGQTGNTINTAGWGSGTAFVAGDILGWVDPTGRSVLHRVVADATVSAGACAVPIAPAIRRSPASGAAINLSSPSPVWRLQRDDVQPDYTPGDRGFSVSLPIEEAIW